MVGAAKSLISRTGPQVRLRLMATTDVHAALMPFDYVADTPDPHHGLAKCARLIEQARTEVPGNLLFDCGDFLEGTALADLLARPLPEGPDAAKPHLVIAAMNALGYAAAALGNHDFNYGLGVLRRALRGAAFPTLCANLVGRGTTQTAFPGAVILSARAQDDQRRWHPVRVGVFGVLPPQTVEWDRAHLGATHWVLPILATARRRSQALRAAGADIVVALCHSGLPATPSGLSAAPNAENVALDVARLSSVDAVFCGHSHGMLPGPQYAVLEPHVPGFNAMTGTLNGTPIAMAGAAGRALAVVDLTLSRDQGRWKPEQAQTTLRRFSQASPASETISHLVAPAHIKTRSALSVPVGETDVALHTLFTPAAGSRVTDLIALAQRDYAAQILRTLPDVADLPLLSAAAPFRAGGHGPSAVTEILPGKILRRHLYDIYPFPNSFALVEVSGADLRDWLLDSAKVFATLRSGTQNQALLRPDIPTYSFDALYGAQATFDLTKAPNDPQRVAALTIGGRAVQPTDQALVATNSYRAGLLSARGQVQRVLPTPNRLSRDLVEKTVAPGLTWRNRPLECPWQFAPCPGASVWFHTSPLAWSYVDDARRSGITLGHYDDAGYLRAAMTL